MLFCSSFLRQLGVRHSEPEPLTLLVFEIAQTDQLIAAVNLKHHILQQIVELFDLRGLLLNDDTVLTLKILINHQTLFIG